MHNGVTYYRTRIRDADGKRVALYGKTREELYDKVEEAKRQIEDKIFRQKTPTVKEYAEKMAVHAVGPCQIYDNVRLHVKGEKLHHSAAGRYVHG